MSDEKQTPAEDAVVEAEATELKSEESEKPSKPRKSKIKFDSGMSREEAVAYFEAIVNGLKKGSLVFRQNEETLELAVGDQVEVEVKASRKGDSESVRFEPVHDPRRP